MIVVSSVVPWFQISDNKVVTITAEYAECGCYGCSKEEEALFNVAYLNKQHKLCRAFIRHNIFLTDTVTYVPYSIFLAQPLLCERQQGSC